MRSSQLADLCKVAHMTNAVHMARHDVATQAVMGTQGFFKVDATQFGQATGAGQRFGRDVDGELMGVEVKAGDGHARAIQSDAVPQTDVVEITCGRLQSEALAVV